jgi:hypothetical protein
VTTSPAGLETLLPDVSDLQEWKLAEPPLFYGPETLFEYLDGGAPQYTSYGFVKLAHARYVRGGDDMQSVTVDAFDMGSPLGAYGIYSAGRPRDGLRRKWGVEGYRSGTIAAAWRDRFYVYGSAGDETETLVAMLEELVAGACRRIPGEAAPPQVLSALPREGLVAGSDRYVGKNLLGHAFLGGGFLANYTVGGRESLLFLSDLQSASEAQKDFELLRAHDRQRGRWLREDASIGEAGFWSKDPARGCRYQVRFGRWIAGVWEVEDESRAAQLMRELLANLPR